MDSVNFQWQGIVFSYRGIARDTRFTGYTDKGLSAVLAEFKAPEARKDLGLQGVLNSVFPIEGLGTTFLSLILII